jgi:histidinol-phosphate aminotransferase
MRHNDTTATRRKGPLRLHLNEPTARGGDDIRCYPDGRGFARAVAARLNVPEESILLTAGADGGLDAACRAVTGSALVLDPDYPNYPFHAEKAGLAVLTVEVPLNGRFPAQELLRTAAARKPDLILLSTIGNPTGYRLPPGLVEQLRAASPGSLLVIDEVYREFAGWSCAELAGRTPGLLSVGSVSKSGGPGLRAGYVVGHPETLARVARFVPRFPVAGPSLRLATRLLSSPSRIQTVVQRQEQAREHLARSLRQRGFAVREGANWVLAKLGPGAHALARRLLEQGVEVLAPQHPALREWLRISTPDLDVIHTFTVLLDRALAGPVVESDGRLEFRDAWLAPEPWLDAAPVLRLQGEVVEIDHYAITLADGGEHAAFARALESRGVRIVEGPGLWPINFCAELADFPPDLWMRFATFALPSGVLLVTAAPHAPGDQIDRFRRGRGPRGVHHVAVRVDDVAGASAAWRAAGWSPLSSAPAADTGLVQWFLRNTHGQIVELIARPGAGTETFTCSNLKALRAAELEK